jgi:hypothetical protein
VCGAANARLGPLAVEQKKRVVGKRAKFEKNKADERRPQELREEDIARSENETTKHVIDVSSQKSKTQNPWRRATHFFFFFFFKKI